MKKIITIVIILLVAGFGIWGWWKYFYTYSEGNRSGLLQKFSHKGNVFKTYEGELVLNSITANGTVAPYSSEKFYFSVDDKALGERMKNFEGQRVVLHYNQKNGALPWLGETPYIVDSVTLLK
ncbi:6-phosphogluconate dehydrogenase [soil metagenome]